jgi:hypothetical protein
MGTLRAKFNRLVGHEKDCPSDDEGEGDPYRAGKLVPRSKFVTAGVAPVRVEKEPVIGARKPVDVNARAFKI